MVRCVTLNYLLDIAPDNKADGYVVPTGEFTAISAILFFFMVLGFGLFVFFLIKLGLFLAKKYVWIEENEESEE